MSPDDANSTAISRRDVLKNVGFAGAASAASTGIGAGATGDCEPAWGAGTCVVTTQEARIYESCEGSGIGSVPTGTEARVTDWSCCNGTTMYY